MHSIITGDYMYRYSAWKVFLFWVDILLVSFVYILSGLLFSAWFDDEMIGYLDRSQGNLWIFIQTMGEMILNIAATYFVMHFFPKIPSIISDPPPEHLIFRTRGGDVFFTFALVAAQLLYLDKLRFLYNEVKDARAKSLDEVLDNWQVCQDGSISSSGEFTCQP
jgi:hypothetical protein